MFGLISHSRRSKVKWWYSVLFSTCFSPRQLISCVRYREANDRGQTRHEIEQKKMLREIVNVCVGKRERDGERDRGREKEDRGCVRDDVEKWTIRLYTSVPAHSFNGDRDRAKNNINSLFKCVFNHLQPDDSFCFPAFRKTLFHWQSIYHLEICEWCVPMCVCVCAFVVQFRLDCVDCHFSRFENLIENWYEEQPVAQYCNNIILCNLDFTLNPWHQFTLGYMVFLVFHFTLSIFLPLPNCRSASHCVHTLSTIFHSKINRYKVLRQYYSHLQISMSMCVCVVVCLSPKPRFLFCFSCGHSKWVGSLAEASSQMQQFLSA